MKKGVEKMLLHLSGIVKVFENGRAVTKRGALVDRSANHDYLEKVVGEFMVQNAMNLFEQWRHVRISACGKPWPARLVCAQFH